MEECPCSKRGAKQADDSTAASLHRGFIGFLTTLQHVGPIQPTASFSVANQVCFLLNEVVVILEHVSLLFHRLYKHYFALHQIHS